MRTTIISLVLAFAAIQAVTAQVYTPSFEKYSLENGLQVVLHQDTTIRSIVLNVAYNAGSAYDPPGKHGLANLTGSLYLVQTGEIPAQDLLAIQYKAPGKISGRTDVDIFSTSSAFPSNYLETALWIESSRMKSASNALTEPMVQDAIAKIIESRKEQADVPMKDLSQAIYANLYPEGYPYRHTIGGDTAHMATLTSKDVNSFMDRFYVPSNASITIGGYFDVDETKQWVKKYFGTIPAGKQAAFGKLPPLPELGKASMIMEEFIDHTKMFLVFPTVPLDHVDEPALEMLGTLLAGSINGKLIDPLVAKNPYVTSVQAYQSSQLQDGNFWIVLDCTIEARLPDVLYSVQQLIERLGAVLIEDEDVADTYTLSMLGLASRMERLGGLDGRCALMNKGNLLTDSPAFYSTMVDIQRLLNANAMKEMITKYLSFENYLVVSVVPSGKTDQAVYEP